MRNFLYLVLAALCLNHVAAYKKYSEAEYIYMACNQAVTMTSVFCKKKTDPANCTCTNMDRMGSLLYCGQKEAKTEHLRKGFEHQVLEACPKFTAADLKEKYENATHYIQSPKEIPGFNKTKPVHVPVIYNKVKYGYALKTYKARYHNEDDSMAMGGALIGYWGVIILIGTVLNIFEKLFPKQWLAAHRSFSNNMLVKFMRKYFFMPALIGKKHTERNFFLGVVPTRVQSVVVFVFSSLVIIFSAVRMHYMENNITWPRKKIQLTRYVGDRTGIISCFLIPLTYFMAGRNNFFAFMTGWKQSTFLIYHKWIARATVLCSVAHSIAYYLNSMWFKKMKTRKLTIWYRMGTLATIAFAVMFCISIGWVRTHHYELFLNTHICLAIISIAGLYYHLRQFDLNQYTYAAIAIWGFDRVVRVVRLFSFGAKKATITVVNNEMLHVTVPKPAHWPTFPGAFGFVYFLNSSCFWQSHPFTIVSSKSNTEINFYIKIKNGVTHTIYKKLLDKPGMTGTFTVSVEGPYGNGRRLEAFDDVVMISSSNGIASNFSYARQLSEIHKKTGNKTFVKFYWIVRHWHSLDWFLNELKEMKDFDNVEPIIYVTKYHEGKVGEKLLASSGSDSSDADEKNSVKVSDAEYNWLESIKNALPHIEFRDGRPDFEQIVKSDLSEFNGQNVAVLTCAHNALSDDIRYTVANEIPNHDGRVDLFEEIQVW